MRVLNIMLGGKRGGIEQAAVNYAAALRARGHDALSIIRKGAAVAPLFAEQGLPTLEIAAPYAWNIFARRQIRQAMKNADAVILHGNRAAQMTRGSKTPSRPVIPVIHSRFFDMMPHFSALIASSQAMLKHARPGCPAYFLPNAVAVPDDAARPAFRQPPVVGTMGRMSEEKGMDLFIDAVALLRGRGIDVQAVIGGAGGIENGLRARAEKAGLSGVIDFSGWVTDRRAFFDGIDVFCLSSRTETFPITLLEAMAHAVPSVATRCGGPQEIIEDGRTGYLADITAESIAAALEKALRDPAAAADSGAAGRAEMAAKYHADVIAAQLDGILRKVSVL